MATPRVKLIGRDGEDVSERFWGDGKVFKALAGDALDAEDGVQVSWFGSRSASVRLVQATETPRSLTDMDLSVWLSGIREALSDCSMRDAEEIVRMIRSGESVLITGSSGSGKSMLMTSIASGSGVPIENVCLIQAGSVASLADTETIRSLVFQMDKCNGIILLDNIERLVPKKKTNSADRQVSTLILRAIARARDRNVPLLSATSCPEDVDPVAMGYGMISRTHRLGAPNHLERVALLQRRGLSESDAEWIASRSSGWSRAEVDSVSRDVHVRRQAKDTLEGEDLQHILMEARKHTSLYRDSAFVLPGDDGNDGDEDQAWLIQHSEVFSSSRIGGLRQARAVLTSSVIHFFTSTNEGTRGFLLHGPSGNGKTLIGLELGAAIQRRGLANFVCVRCLDLVSKVVGDTEQNVSRVFAKARDCSPCLLFLDQLDALVPRRSSEDGETTTERTFERVLGLLLTELDGIMTKDFRGKMVVIAAVQHVRDLEPAVVRPGRLGLHVLVDTPGTKEERAEVVRVCTRKMPMDAITKEFYDRLCGELLEGKTRAEIANVCREAATLALRESIEAEKVREDHFLLALSGSYRA